MALSSITKQFQITVNVGYECTTFVVYFSEMAAKKEAIRKVQLLDEIVRIDENFYSMVFSVLYKTKQDLEKKLALIKELLAIPKEPLKLYDLSLPDPKLKLSETD